MTSMVMNDYMPDPLMSDGWIQFNEENWGLHAERIEILPEKGSAWRLEAVFYRDSKGAIVMPPRNPHVPVLFETATTKLASYNRRKREALERLAEWLDLERVKSSIPLSPMVDDSRPFQWLQMDTTPRYTWYIDLSCFEEHLDSGVKKQYRKAERMGYHVESTKEWDTVINCLESPETRKGFSYKLDADSLGNLVDAASNNVKAFLSTDSDGKPVGARLLLYSSGGLSIGWSAGIDDGALRDGVNALLGIKCLHWLDAQGCRVFDFGGANIRPVSAMKEAWGGRLVSYYVVNQRNFRNLGRHLHRMFNARTR